MKSQQLKVARIGNSRGVRIPATTLARYRVGDSVIMEETTEGILLRPHRAASPKLSWEATAQAMALDSEDWSDWDGTLADGLEQFTWQEPSIRRVAERPAPYVVPSRKPKRVKR